MGAMKGIALFLLCAVVMLQGCVFVVGAGAGAATVAYVGGELKTTYAASFNRTWEASLGALRDLEISVYNTKKEMSEGVIEATRKDGKKVKLNLKSIDLDTTSVEIRVGVFGDEETSRAINRRISARLGKK